MKTLRDSTHRIQWLNSLSTVDAEAEFLKCCGSTRWAREMINGRPFADLDRLFEAAARIWWSLSEPDWLEAFRAHPKIGETKATTVQSQQAKNWSAQEQAGVADASMSTIAELAQRNRDYENRFGFIFIVCASGRSSNELLASLNDRVQNDPRKEIRVAAEEQRKITALRLEKLASEHD